MGLLGFALYLGSKLWLWPLTWKLEFGVLALAVFLGQTLASVAIPCGIFAVLIRTRARRPAQFTVHSGRFVVPTSPVFGSSLAIMLLYLSAISIPLERVPVNDSPRMTRVDFIFPFR